MDSTPDKIQPQQDEPPKRKRGRPKGSKNKPKPPGYVKKPKVNDGRSGRGIWVYDPSLDQTLKSASGMTIASQPRAKTAAGSGGKKKAGAAGGRKVAGGAAGKKKGRIGPKMARVYAVLEALGVKDTRRVSSCLKQGILQGFVKLEKPEDDSNGEFGLDQVILEDRCMLCDGALKCHVKDVLYQPDFGGHDYEDGAQDAPFKCYSRQEGDEEEEEEEDVAVCHGWYVTGICCNNPAFDSGKFHNHCSECPQFGTCLGDYREQHCSECGKHYFGSFGQLECPTCHPEAGSSEDDGF